MVKRKRRKRKSRYHRGIHVSLKCDHDCHYRSGWEFSYLQWLDSNDDVISYQYEKVKIPYISNVKTGKLRTYYPDILILYSDGHQVLVEIKPKKKLVQAIVKKKLAAAAIWCSEHGIALEIVTEIELKTLGLLK